MKTPRELTKRELTVMKNTLTGGGKDVKRNEYYSSTGHSDQFIIEELVWQGLMKKKDRGAYVYELTDEGMRIALDHINPEVTGPVGPAPKQRAPKAKAESLLDS